MSQKTAEEWAVEEDRIIAGLIAEMECHAAAGRLHDACVGFCHEGLQVHDIVGRGTPEGYVRFGFCGSDVRVPLSDLPPELRPTEDSDRGLYSMDSDQWPQVMKDAMRPLVDYALGILRQGGMGC